MITPGGRCDKCLRLTTSFMVKMGLMEWIYLSPHLDDVALSCGGLVWEQTRAGDRAAIWTLCAGDPPGKPFSPFAELLHARWDTGEQAVEQRRQEDAASCARLGASFWHFPIPDCIYRRSPKDGAFLYASEEALFDPLHLDEAELVETLRRELAQSLPLHVQVVCPLALGGHVDHRLARMAAALLDHNDDHHHRPLLYYADYPYVLRCEADLDAQRRAGWEPVHFPLSEPGLEAWQAAVAAHASQISSFWPDETSMQVALRDYAAKRGGVELWQNGGEKAAASAEKSIQYGKENP